MKKHYFKYFLLLLIVPFMFLTTACDKTKVVDIVIKSNNVELETEIERYYGDNTGLYDFEIFAIYKDQTVDISNKCEFTIISPSEQEITYNEYLQKAYSSNLDIGNWVFAVSFENFTKSFYINILEPLNTNIYTMQITADFCDYTDENEMPYGTKQNGLSISYFENDVPFINNQSQYSQMYMLKSNINYDSNLTPNDNNVEIVSNFDELLPGSYYFTTKIKKVGYSEKFTNFTEFTVVKSKVFILDVDNLIFDWTFSSTSSNQDVKFSEIMGNTNQFLQISGGQLVFNNDFDDTNNDNYYMNKKTDEYVFDSLFEYYGTFVAIDDSVTFNASTDYQTIMLKYVPNAQNLQYYTESDPFEAKLLINQGKVSVPDIECDCCTDQHTYAPDMTHELQIYAPFTNLYTIQSDNDKYIDNEYITYSTSTTNSIVIKFTIKNLQNYNWNISYFSPSGYSSALNYASGELVVTLAVRKGNLDNYNITIKPSNNSNLLVDDKIDLMITDNVSGKCLTESNFVWEVLPIGSTVNNAISLSYGELTDTTSKENNSIYKTLTISDILDFAKEYETITVAIKITCAETENWNAYETTLLVTLRQNN